MLFQYQAGPRESYLEISSSAKGFEGANCSGNRMVCVAASSGTVRSTTRMPPRRMPSTRVDNVCECVAMVFLVIDGRVVPGIDDPDDIKSARRCALDRMQLLARQE